MGYYKIIESGYIAAIGTGGGGTEITGQEYDQIMSVIQNKPPRTEMTDYHLREDLTWEEYERPADPVDDETVDAQEALDIIMGEG